MSIQEKEYTAFTNKELQEIGKQIKLNDSWNLYFHAKNSSKLYNDNTTKLIEINNVADFWGTINNVPKPSVMFFDGVNTKLLKSTGETPGALSFFRSKTFPSWENEHNINGFEWSVKLYNDTNIDNIWLNILTTTICEDFENSEILNGIRIVDSSIDCKIITKLEFWFSDKKYQKDFENNIKNIFDFPKSTKLLYRDHCVLKEKKPMYNRQSGGRY